MHTGLQIPLDAAQTTRRDTRRVVSIVSGMVFGFLFGIAFFRMPYAWSETRMREPIGTLAALRILKTPANEHLLSKNLGRQSVFPGSIWSWQQLLDATEHEMTLFILEQGAMAVSIDASIPDALSAAASQFGLSVTNTDGIGTLSQGEVQWADRGRFSFAPSALLPWHDGEITTMRETAPLAINEKGVTLVGLGYDAAPNAPAVAGESTVLANLTVRPEYLSLPPILEPLLSSPSGEIVELFTQRGGTLLVTSDELGTGYAVRIPADDMSTEQLAALGNDIMSRALLSTQEWTIEDGSLYQELRSHPEEMHIDIRAEEGFTFLTLTSPRGDVVRITETNGLLTIANRHIQIENASPIRHVCRARAHSWFSTELLTSPTQSSAPNALVAFLRHFNEIAIENRRLSLCW